MSTKHRFRSQDSELRFMEFLNSVYLSGQAALEEREGSVLTVEQTYNATYKITRAEIINLNKFFAGVDRRLLRKKHKSALAYTAQAEEWLETFASDLEDDVPELERFCKGFVKFFSEVHSLLHEDTRQRVRDEILDAAVNAAVTTYFASEAKELDHGQEA